MLGGKITQFMSVGISIEMNAKQAELLFLNWCKRNGYLHKVAGDNAYSSRPMGQGRYAKMVSARNGKVQVRADGQFMELESISYWIPPSLNIAIERSIDLLIEAESPTFLQRLGKGVATGAAALALTAPLIDPSSTQAAQRSRSYKPTVSHVHKSKVSEKDLDFLTRALYNEAGIDSWEGKKAAASVMWYRGKGDAKGILNAVKKKHAFTAVTVGMMRKGNDHSWEECRRIAKSMLTKSFQPSVKANHYYNPKYVDPYWAYEDPKTKTRHLPYQKIGKHRFLWIESRV